jgi:putative redox protein
MGAERSAKPVFYVRDADLGGGSTASPHKTKLTGLRGVSWAGSYRQRLEIVAKSTDADICRRKGHANPRHESLARRRGGPIWRSDPALEDALSEATADLAATGESVIVEETLVGRFQMEARVGATAFLVDEPVKVGGLGTGPNPYDLLSAALGSCTAMTVRLYAEHKAWPLEKVRVRVAHRRDALQARDSFSREIELEGSLDDTQRARLLEIAERCPVHLTLERGSDVATKLLPAKARAAGEGATEGEHMKHMEEACAK